MEPILRRVRSARRALVLQDMLLRIIRGLFWTLLAAAALILAHRAAHPVPPWSWGALGAALLLGASILAIHRRPSLRTAAMALDRAANLEDRLSAALYVRADDSPIARAIREDALAALAKAGDPPLGGARLPIRRLALPALLLLGFLWIPLPALRGYSSARAAAQAPEILVPEPVRKEESQKLRRRAFSLEKLAKELDRPELRELAEAMRKASEELRKEEVSRNEALARLSSLEEQSREQKRQLSAKLPEGLLRRLRAERAGGPAREASAPARLSDQAAALRSAAERLKAALEASKSGAAPDGALERELAELSKQLSGDLGSELPADLAARLAEALKNGAGTDLSDLARSLKDLEQSLQNLDAVSGLQAELDGLSAEKDDLADAGGTCAFCGQLLRGPKGSPCPSCGSSGTGEGSRASQGKTGDSGPGSGPGVGHEGGPGRGPKGAPEDRDPRFATRPAAQIHPEGLIQSLQFKSLPEKGDLRSAYTQAYRALSAEASQALEQEEVPPGYRVHVRDYFDAIRPDPDKK